jgi:small-conductance mechanosensitive channel
VRLADLTDAGLRVEVMAWLTARDYDAFAALRGEVLLAILEAVERSGARFAYPTRTVEVAPVADPRQGPPPAGRRPGQEPW